MGISLISISHQNAPLAVRELFAFPEQVQTELMKQMVERSPVSECVTPLSMSMPLQDKIALSALKEPITSVARGPTSAR